MIQLNRSTLLADAHSMHVANRSKKIDFSKPIVNVGKLGIGHRTTVGNAHEYIDYPDTKVGNDTSKAPLDPKDSIEIKVTDPNSGISESQIISKKILSSVGKAVGITIVGTMILGPPTIGYLLFDSVGLVVGSMVAAPFVMIFVWALVS